MRKFHRLSLVGDHQSAERGAVGIMKWATDKLGDSGIGALGRPVVRGGTRFVRPVRVTAELLTDLETLIPLAPCTSLIASRQ
jgi:acetate kinase